MHIARHFAVAGLVLLAMGASSRGGERPTVLVIGFEATGRLLEQDEGIEDRLRVVAETILAEKFTPLSRTARERACEKSGFDASDLMASAERRLAAAREARATFCVAAWAFSVDEKHFLTVETIETSAGTPGRVVTVTFGDSKRIHDVLSKAFRLLGILKGPERASPTAEGRSEATPCDLTDIWERMPEDDLLEAYPNAAWKALVELRESATSVWCDANTYGRAQLHLVEVLTHVGRLHGDPGYRAEHEVRADVATDPFFATLDYEVVSHPPHLLFVERGAILDLTRLEAVTRLLDGFRGLLPDGVDLPSLADSPYASERVVKGFILASRESFTGYQKASGRMLPAGASGYYRIDDQWVILCAEVGRGYGGTEFVIESLLHETSHQIVHHYTKVLLEQGEPEEVAWLDPRIRPRSYWLSEGLAEWLSVSAATDEFSPGRRHVTGLRIWKATRDEKLPEWTLRDLLAIEGSRDLRVRATRAGLFHRARLVYLILPQAWSLVDFLWNHDGGKYRQKLRRLVHELLQGRSGPGVFERVWTSDGDELDLDLLEREWTLHVRALLAEPEAGEGD